MDEWKSKKFKELEKQLEQTILNKKYEAFRSIKEYEDYIVSHPFNMFSMHRLVQLEDLFEERFGESYKSYKNTRQ